MYSTAGPSSALSSLRFAEELEDDDLYDFSDVPNQGPAAPVSRPPLVREPKRLGSSSSLASIAESAEEALAESGDISDDAASSKGSSPLEGSLSEASLNSGGEGHSHPELQQQRMGVNKFGGDQQADNLGGAMEDPVADGELACEEEELETDDEDVLDMLGLEDVAGGNFADDKPGLATLKVLPPLGKGLPPLNPLARPPFRPTPLFAGAPSLMAPTTVLQDLQPSLRKGSLGAESWEEDLMLTAGKSMKTAVETSAIDNSNSLWSQTAGEGSLGTPVREANAPAASGSKRSESLSDLEGNSSVGRLSSLGEEVASEDDEVEGGLSGEESPQGVKLSVGKSEGSKTKQESKGVSGGEESGDPVGGSFEGEGLEGEATEGGSMEDEELEEGLDEREDHSFENGESGLAAESDGVEEGELVEGGAIGEDRSELDEGGSENGFGEEGADEDGEGLEEELDEDGPIPDGIEALELQAQGSSDSGKLGGVSKGAKVWPSAFQLPVLTHAPERSFPEGWRAGVVSRMGEEQPAVVEKKVEVDGPILGGSVLSARKIGEEMDQSIGRPPLIAGTGGALALLERKFAQEKLLELLSATRQDADKGSETAEIFEDENESGLNNPSPGLDWGAIGRDAPVSVSTTISRIGATPLAAEPSLEKVNFQSGRGFGPSKSVSDDPSEVPEKLEVLETLMGSLKEPGGATNAGVSDVGSSVSVPLSVPGLGNLSSTQNGLQEPAGQERNPDPHNQNGVATSVVPIGKYLTPISPGLILPVLNPLSERNTSGTEASASRTATRVSESGKTRAGIDRSGSPLLQPEGLLGLAPKSPQAETASAERQALMHFQRVESRNNKADCNTEAGSQLEDSVEKAVGEVGGSVGSSGAAGMSGEDSDGSGNGADSAGLRGRKDDEGFVKNSDGLENGKREDSSPGVSRSNKEKDLDVGCPVSSGGDLRSAQGPRVALRSTETAETPGGSSETQRIADTWSGGKPCGLRREETEAVSTRSGGESGEKGLAVSEKATSSHAIDISEGIPLAEGQAVNERAGSAFVMAPLEGLRFSSPPEALSGEPLAGAKHSNSSSSASQKGLSSTAAVPQTLASLFHRHVTASNLQPENSASPSPLKSTASQSDRGATMMASDYVGGRPSSSRAGGISVKSSESPTEDVQPVQIATAEKAGASEAKDGVFPSALQQKGGQSKVAPTGKKRDEERRGSLWGSRIKDECSGESDRGNVSGSSRRPRKEAGPGECSTEGSTENRDVSESSNGGSVSPREDLKRTDRAADVVPRSVADVGNHRAPAQLRASCRAEPREVGRRPENDVSRSGRARDDVGRHRLWGEADENADVGDSDFGGRLLSREIRELRKIQEARRAAEKERLGAAVSALQEWKTANGGAGTSNGNERRRSSQRKAVKRGHVISDVSSEFSFESPIQSDAPIRRMLHAPPLAEPRGLEVSRAAERAAADALESAHVATSRAAELEQALARKEREVARLARVAEGFSRGAGAAERALQAEVAEMARERDGALQERKALLEQLARRDRQLTERCDEVDRLKSAFAKLADQRAAESARAEDAARAREVRVRELEEGLRVSERLRAEAEVEMRTHQERQSHFTAERKRLSDALTASQASEQGLVQKLDALQSRLSDALSAARASEQGLVQKLDVLQSRIDASSETRLRASEAANTALTQKVEGLLTKISALEAELRHVARPRARRVAPAEDVANRATLKEQEESVESPKSVSGLLSDGEEEPLTGNLEQSRVSKTVKWPKPGQLAASNPQTTHAEESPEQSASQEEPLTETSGRRASTEWNERLVQSDGEGQVGGRSGNRASGEKVAELEREVKQLRGALNVAKEGQQAGRGKYAALLRNLRTWMEGRRYMAKTAPQLTALIPLLAWRNLPAETNRMRARWHHLAEGLCAENAESPQRQSFVSRMSRLRHHRRCLSAHVDRQSLLAALRVWRAEVTSGEARAAGERARAREEELERITCALPWWVRRVSERAALARFFLHWRLAGVTGKRQGLEVLQRESEPEADPGHRKSLEEHPRKRNSAEEMSFVEVPRDIKAASMAESGAPAEELNGMLGADGGDAIQVELRAIREMVQERLLELSQHDELSTDVPEKRPGCAQKASVSDGLHMCQSQKDVIQHLITILTDLQDRATGGVTPAAASAGALQTPVRDDETTPEMEMKKENETGSFGSRLAQGHVEEEERNVKISSEERADDAARVEVKVIDSARQSAAEQRGGGREKGIELNATHTRRRILRGTSRLSGKGRTRHWAP
ncbi:hypothetical protein KFL_002210180 [Klebsormidium nitens]|uniref:Uncharacterized protein n=1 Tax=Klebsormidium nitens TaxID=105231 RepID=A0A1Y1I3T1_KLENI|nr:hypothetical protein KFL_002210180 [Klebsormidium nitens]|eukprot:GAQ85153.1 hypothetical protein KFL_002210180 [Klebsormidium nitens]